MPHPSPIKDMLIAYFQSRNNEWATVRRIVMDLKLAPNKFCNVSSCLVTHSVEFERRKTGTDPLEYRMRSEESYRWPVPESLQKITETPKPVLEFKLATIKKEPETAFIRLAPLVYVPYSELSDTIKRVCNDHQLLATPGVAGEFLLHDVLGYVKLRVKGATIAAGVIQPEGEIHVERLQVSG